MANPNKYSINHRTDNLVLSAMENKKIVDLSPINVGRKFLTITLDNGNIIRLDLRSSVPGLLNGYMEEISNNFEDIKNEKVKSAKIASNTVRVNRNYSIFYLLRISSTTGKVFSIRWRADFMQDPSFLNPLIINLVCPED